jgi:hypothetical protein
MLQDRYGAPLATRSPAARDAYVEACDLMLSSQPGAEDAFGRAVAVDAGFALAHVGLARARQFAGDMAAAKSALADAEAASAGVSAREASHLAFYRRLLGGQADAALAAASAHLAQWPRDAMVLAPCCGVYGLVGFSGRLGREQELARLLDGLATHYGEDWWFGAQHAFALIESGRSDAARPKIERAFAARPDNANAAHILAHLYYEDGEQQASRAFIASWLPGYARTGGLYGHISWHLALCDLEAGDTDAAFQRYAASLAPDVYAGSALFVVADAASFLWRAELAGAQHGPARWQVLHDFAHRMFPGPGIAFADIHCAIIDAVNGDMASLEARTRRIDDLAGGGSDAVAPVVAAVSRSFAAFAAKDYDAAIDALLPVSREHVRIGGSRAQRDLVEFTLLKAYVLADRLDEARRMLRDRRPGASAPVAGLH